MLGAENYKWAPVHTSDIAAAAGSALSGSATGKFSLAGKQQLSLRQIVDALEEAADKSAGSTRGPLIPPFDYLWDFFYGTGADLNMSRLVDFYEKNDVQPYAAWTETSPEHEF